jgi:hypothetical protein
MTRCKFEFRPGRKCKNKSLPNKQYCLFHEYPEERTNIIKAMENPELFGNYFDKKGWVAWKAILKAVYRIQMAEGEKEIFRRLSGGRNLPEHHIQNLVLICGRRSGKSTIASMLTIWNSLFRTHDENEATVNMLIASDRQQAEVNLFYCTEILESSEVLNSQVESIKKNEIVFKGNTPNIRIQTASFRGVRGWGVPVICCEEVAFWRDSKSGANPASRILEALRPTQANIKNPLLMLISSPWRASGVLYDYYENYYGKNDKHTLVIQAPTEKLNHEINPAFIEREYKNDRISALSEYGAEFRTDISDFIDSDLLESITAKNILNRPYDKNNRYFAFVDVSGGRKDSFSLSISHIENSKVIVDIALEIPAPVKPKNAVKQICETLKDFGILEVTGDRYSGEWAQDEFENYGIMYKESIWDKSRLYLEFSGIAQTGQVEILDIEKLQNQFKSLIRKPRTGTHDSVDHPEGMNDDIANSVAGATVTAFKERPMSKKEMTSRLPSKGKKIRKKMKSAHEEMDDFMKKSGGRKIRKIR